MKNYLETLFNVCLTLVMGGLLIAALALTTVIQ